MLVIVCVLISAFLVACNNTDDPNTHTHTYSTEWTSDESHHWHAATCEHTEEVADKGTHVRGEDDTCSTCGYEMPPVTVDDGHSILSAEGYDISGTVLTKKDRFSKDTEQYDLRGAFEISEGATWNVFTSADCKTEDWLPNRIVTLEQGENSVYVLVEDKTGNNSTVYEVRLYRRSEVTVTVVYNESEQKKIDIEEDSPILSTLGDSVLGDYIYYKYYLDSAFTSELSAELTATEDIPLYVDAYYVGVSLSGGTVVGLNANTRPSGTFKLLIDNSLLGVTVTKIGEDAFRDMENMTECTLPDTVTGIEGSAFRGCKALKKIDLPDSLTQIKGSAFSSCESLTEITIPENVESIGNYAFFDCKNLKTVYYNAKRCADISTKSYDDGVFVHTFSLSDLVIDKFQIGKTVQYVPSNLFATDTDPESGSGDFEQPMYIKSLVFEEESTCTAIGKYAFAYKRCYDSGEVEYSGTVVGDIFIPSSVDEIGDFAFGSTPWAENVYIASDVESYFKLAQKTSLANNIYIKGELLTSVTIPDSYSSIGAYWFSYVHSIKHVTIPEGITSIPAKAFYACIGLCSVDIPASVSSIGNSAFTYCRELKEIVIPDAVSTIPENCFDSCYKLYKITLLQSCRDIQPFKP